MRLGEVSCWMPCNFAVWFWWLEILNWLWLFTPASLSPVVVMELQLLNPFPPAREATRTYSCEWCILWRKYRFSSGSYSQQLCHKECPYPTSWWVRLSPRARKGQGRSGVRTHLCHAPEEMLGQRLILIPRTSGQRFLSWHSSNLAPHRVSPGECFCCQGK